jgi:hypothetical protein
LKSLAEALARLQPSHPGDYPLTPDACSPIPLHRAPQSLFEIYKLVVAEPGLNFRDIRQRVLHIPLAHGAIFRLPFLACETLQDFEVSFSVTRRPVATLNICPAAFYAAAVHASRFASTALSI